ncbi:transcription factor 7-like 1-A [Cheilinus undulatus]|uniref:transcription factor 7-like 1-A n=1 Tax=Cheilinus undulatus TaxID=241271 RepID=UPI001BD22615|nr:transcription factor 7-like 1-A [Cheilinus undulatus]
MASAFSQFSVADTDRVQPLDSTGNGAGALNVDWALPCSGHGCGELPPISTFLKHPQQYHTDVSQGVGSRTGGRDSVQPETAAPSPQFVEAAIEVPLQESGWLDYQQPHQDQVHLNPTSAGPVDRGGPVSSFAFPPSEQDLLLQAWQETDGYIKRPMNAFLLWSQIYRRTVNKLNTGLTLADTLTSSQLGHKWSQLSTEEKRPYFEMAHKLKQMHQLRFPDYVYRPRGRKGSKCLSSGHRARQDSSFFAFRPMSIPQQSFQDPSMNPYPTTAPSTMCYHHGSSFYPYKPTSLYSATTFQCGRYPYAYSGMSNTENHLTPHPQRNQSELAYTASQFGQQKYSTIDNCHRIMMGSNSTPEGHNQPDIFPNQQPSANNLNSTSDTLTDVDGLF